MRTVLNRGWPQPEAIGALAVALFVLVAGVYSFISAQTFGQNTEAMSRPAGGSDVSTSRMAVDDPNATPTSEAPAVSCPECEDHSLAQLPPPTPTPLPTATPAPRPTPHPVVQPLPQFDIPSRAVAVLEAPCGALVFGKDEHESLPPASLTKIMTALTAIDRLNLQDSVAVEVSGKALKKATRSSIMGLEPGMDVSVQDLLYGLFLPSGNDAALELAEHVSGDVPSFVAEMNQEASRLGLYQTHFTNPHGLDSPGLVSTAYDMARAGLIMMQNPVLAEISSTSSYTLEGGLLLRNGNKLLGSYPGAYGVKIGFTNRAKHTIVAAASRGGRDLYVAVLGSENLYPETSAILDWAFSATKPACG